MCVRLTYYHRYLEGTVSVLKDFRSYLYGALRPGNRTGEFLWYVYVKGAKFGNLPNKLLDNALWDDEDAEPAVPSEEDLDAPPERASVSQNALIEAEGGGVNYVILDDDDVVVAPDANPFNSSDEDEDEVDVFLSRPLPENAPPWAAMANALFKEVKDMPLPQVCVSVKSFGFELKPGNYLRATPPGDFPCFFELVGKNCADRYSEVITSKRLLVAYLRDALERVHGGVDVQLESERRALLAVGSVGENTGDDAPALDDVSPGGAEGAVDALPVEGTRPEGTPLLDSETAQLARVELLEHLGLLKGDPGAEAKCDAALGSFMRPSRGWFKDKDQTLKDLCEHQFAFHLTYGNDASPTALYDVNFPPKRGFCVPDFVFEDKSDVNATKVV